MSTNRPNFEADVPHDVLKIIFNKLTTFDWIVIKSVTRSWHALVKQLVIDRVGLLVNNILAAEGNPSELKESVYQAAQQGCLPLLWNKTLWEPSVTKKLTALLQSVVAECLSLDKGYYASTDEKAQVICDNLQYADLSGMKISVLSRVDLHGANLTGLRLKWLSDANLTEANLTNANLKECRLNDVNFTRANLTKVNFQSASISKLNLTDVIGLTKEQLLQTAKAKMDQDNYGFSFRETIFPKNFDFSHIDLRYACFRAATLIGVIFTGSQLQKADFGCANLEKGDFSNLVLNQINFFKSILKFADLSYVIISDYTNLTHTDLTQCCLVGSSIKDIDINEVIGLTKKQISTMKEISSSRFPIGLDLSHVDLSNKKLCNNTFNSIDFTSTKFNRSNLRNTQFYNSDFNLALFKEADLTNVIVGGAKNLSIENIVQAESIKNFTIDWNTLNANHITDESLFDLKMNIAHDYCDCLSSFDKNLMLKQLTEANETLTNRGKYINYFNSDNRIILDLNNQEFSHLLSELSKIIDNPIHPLKLIRNSITIGEHNKYGMTDSYAIVIHYGRRLTSHILQKLWPIIGNKEQYDLFIKVYGKELEKIYSADVYTLKMKLSRQDKDNSSEILNVLKVFTENKNNIPLYTTSWAQMPWNILDTKKYSSRKKQYRMPTTLEYHHFLTFQFSKVPQQHTHCKEFSNDQSEVLMKKHPSEFTQNDLVYLEEKLSPLIKRGMI